MDGEGAETMREYGMEFSTCFVVRNCVVKPSIYRKNLGSLDAILALHVDVEIF